MFIYISYPPKMLSLGRIAFIDQAGLCWGWLLHKINQLVRIFSHGLMGHDRLFRHESIARGRRLCSKSLNSWSMPQCTYLIIFQTYHTAEPCRPTYAQLALYNMRKSSFVYNACCSIDHKSWLFRAAPAKIALLKLRQVKLIVGVSKLFHPELMMKAGPKTGSKRLSCTVWYTTRFMYRTLCAAYVPSYMYCRMWAITLPYTSPNTVYYPCTLRSTYDIRQKKRAWLSGPLCLVANWFKPWRQARGMSEFHLIWTTFAAANNGWRSLRSH